WSPWTAPSPPWPLLPSCPGAPPKKRVFSAADRGGPMPTTVACPQCGSKLRVPEELAGQEGRRARRGSTFTAPASFPDPPAETRRPPDHPPSAAPPAPPPPPAAAPGEDLAFRLKLSLDDDSADRPFREAPRPREMPPEAGPESPPSRRP